MSHGKSASYPLPDDPTLAAAAAAVRDAGHWAFVADVDWNLLYVTDEVRLTFGGGELAEFAIGHHWYGPEAVQAWRAFRLGANTLEAQRSLFAGFAPHMLADADGDHDELRRHVDPIYHDLIDGLKPCFDTFASIETRGEGLRGGGRVLNVLTQVHDPDGRSVGRVVISKPGLGMHAISILSFEGDPRHLERTTDVTSAGRRPAAILFADLESSSQLSRRLPTAAYFDFGRRLVSAADQAVVEAGGIVGRHAGDGVVAFFLAEHLGSESAAAAAAVATVGTLRSAISGVVARTGTVDVEDAVLRFGLHWGSNLHVGGIITAGRSEVTALGDAVNECARIEACATGGRALASKDLMERLDSAAAADLGLDPAATTYVALSELPSATEKAKRDAPAIPVCEI